jgi:integrase
MKGHIRERSPGHWAIVIEMRDPATGKRRRKWHSFRGSKKGAQTECAKLIAAMDEGSYVESNKQTVERFLLDRITQWEAGKKITASTAERYRGIAANQIVPHLGARKLQSLKPQDVEAWHNTLIASGRRDGKGGLSARTVHHEHRLLSKALNEATRFGLIVKNVATTEKPPKVDADEVEIVGESDLNKLLDKLKGHALEPIAVTALFTGLRRSEVLALRWRNVDLDRGVIKVVEALEETAAHGVRFKQPKTRAGKRDVTLPELVIATLRRHRLAQLELRAQLGLGKLGDDDLLFPHPTRGGPIPPRNFSNRTWKWAVKSFGMPDINFHALRHTHASQLIAAGVDVVTVSKRLGHSSPTVTLAVYSHLFASNDSKAAKAINEALGSIR